MVIVTFKVRIFFPQCSTTDVTKAVVCTILSMGILHIKDLLLLIEKSNS